MDISSAVSSANVSSQASMAVAAKALEVMEEQGAQQVRMIEQAGEAQGDPSGGPGSGPSPDGRGSLVDVTG
jgi:hypothetical protein